MCKTYGALAYFGQQKPQANVAQLVPSVPTHLASIKPDPEDYYNDSLAATGPYGSNTPVYFHNGRQVFDAPGFQTPILKRSRSDLSVPNTPENAARSKYRRWPSETETAESVVVSELPSESTDFVGDDADYSKLKGVRYPGMGLFDSADSAQKRMRNQRKDDSVLKQIEQASSGFEPTEFVWTENGEFQRTRDVYATPSIEGSPVRYSHHCVIICFTRVGSINEADPMFVTRIASLRSATPIGGSEVGFRQPQPHPTCHVRSRPRLESLGRWHPASRVLWRKKSSSKTKIMKAAESPAIATAPLRPMTSSATRQSLALVWKNGQALHHLLLIIMQPELRVLSGSLGKFSDSLCHCRSFLMHMQFRASPAPSPAVHERESFLGITCIEARQVRFVFPRPRERGRLVRISTSCSHWPLFPAPADDGGQSLQSLVRSSRRWILQSLWLPKLRKRIQATDDQLPSYQHHEFGQHVVQCLCRTVCVGLSPRTR